MRCNTRTLLCLARRYRNVVLICIIGFQRQRQRPKGKWKWKWNFAVTIRECQPSFGGEISEAPLIWSRFKINLLQCVCVCVCEPMNTVYATPVKMKGPVTSHISVPAEATVSTGCMSTGDVGHLRGKTTPAVQERKRKIPLLPSSGQK